MKLTKYGSFQFLVKIWNIKLVSDLNSENFSIFFNNSSLKIPLKDADIILIMADKMASKTKYYDTVPVLCAKYLNRRGYI